jgi:hypothetical protein
VTPSVLEVGRAETLAVGGANFTPSSKVRFGANVLATTFGSATSLTALVPASLLAAPGTVPVTVVDPLTGALERDRRHRRQPARDHRHLAGWKVRRGR